MSDKSMVMIKAADLRRQGFDPSEALSLAWSELDDDDCVGTELDNDDLDDFDPEEEFEFVGDEEEVYYPKYNPKKQRSRSKNMIGGLKTEHLIALVAAGVIAHRLITKHWLWQSTATAGVKSPMLSMPIHRAMPQQNPVGTIGSVREIPRADSMETVSFISV